MIKILIVIILLFSGLILFNIFNSNQSKVEDKSVLNVKVEENNKYLVQSDNQARVTVDIIPTILGIDEDQNIFEVSINTHSVEMDYDFSKVIVLKDNLGNTYEALEWTGNRGGHHISGNIIFPNIDNQATEVEIGVLGVSEVDRIFKWDLL